jgi:hypothetical protein
MPDLILFEVTTLAPVEQLFKNKSIGKIMMNL